MESLLTASALMPNTFDGGVNVLIMISFGNPDVRNSSE